MSEISSVLDRIQKGDPSAAEALLPLVYDELRRREEAALDRARPAVAEFARIPIAGDACRNSGKFRYDHFVDTAFAGE